MDIVKHAKNLSYVSNILEPDVRSCVGVTVSSGISLMSSAFDQPSHLTLLRPFSSSMYNVDAIVRFSKLRNTPTTSFSYSLDHQINALS